MLPLGQRRAHGRGDADRLPAGIDVLRSRTLLEQELGDSTEGIVVE
jgi:hypothetical protein